MILSSHRPYTNSSLSIGKMEYQGLSSSRETATTIRQKFLYASLAEMHFRAHPSHHLYSTFPIFLGILRQELSKAKENWTWKQRGSSQLKRFCSSETQRISKNETVGFSQVLKQTCHTFIYTLSPKEDPTITKNTEKHMLRAPIHRGKINILVTLLLRGLLFFALCHT